MPEVVLVTTSRAAASMDSGLPIMGPPATMTYRLRLGPPASSRHRVKAVPTGT